MQHILLISAYTNLDFLLEQLKLYDNAIDFKIYIHWDKKMFSPNILQALSSHKSVKKVLSIYTIYWGGHNLLASMIELCRCALYDLENEGNPECYIHSISGTTIMLRTTDEFKAFFCTHRGLGYMEYFKLPSPNWHEGGLKRLTLQHPLDDLNIRESQQARAYSEYINMQECTGLYSPLPPGTIYGGGCWWSITRDMAIYWVQHYNDNNLYERLKNTFGPEEIHPQTILLNSPYSKNIKNSSLHYICWDYGIRGTPALLENFDLSYMIQSPNIWARKISTNTSDGVTTFYNWFYTLPPLDLQVKVDDKQSLQQIKEYLLKYSLRCPLLGVMDGLMGVVVYLSCYGKVCDDKRCTVIAKNMFDIVVNQRKNIATADFNNGTIGIAYSIAWLCHYNFIPFETNYEEVLSNYDSYVIKALENKEFIRRVQNPFWNKYYNLTPYLKLRNLYNTSLRKDDNANKLLQHSRQNLFKQSIGMAGVAGMGYNILRSLFSKDIPPFIF